jgi:hypothetical protein
MLILQRDTVLAVLAEVLALLTAVSVKFQCSMPCAWPSKCSIANKRRQCIQCSVRQATSPSASNPQLIGHTSHNGAPHIDGAPRIDDCRMSRTTECARLMPASQLIGLNFSSTYSNGKYIVLSKNLIVTVPCFERLSTDLISPVHPPTWTGLPPNSLAGTKTNRPVAFSRINGGATGAAQTIGSFGPTSFGFGAT